MVKKNEVSEKDVIELINEKFKELYESLESLWSSIEGAIEVSHLSIYKQLEILDFKINALIEAILRIREERGFDSEEGESDEEERKIIDRSDVISWLRDDIGFEDDADFIGIILDQLENKGLIEYQDSEGLVVMEDGTKYLKKWKSLEDKTIDELPIRWIKCPKCDYILLDYNFSEYWRREKT